MLAEITYLDFLTIKFFFPIILCLVVGIVLYILCAAKDFETGKFLVLFGTIAAVSYFLGAQLFPNSKYVPMGMGVAIPLLVLFFVYIPSKVRRAKKRKLKEEREAKKAEEERLREQRREEMLENISDKIEDTFSFLKPGEDAEQAEAPTDQAQ